jgi:hypothetical protein
LIVGPNSSAPDVGYITSIAVVAPNSVWAAGRQGIIRWDGTAWAVVPAPPPTTGIGWRVIDGVAANDVWAANGDGTLWHWDGSGWTAANLPGITVTGIDMTGPGAGWAWGTAGPGNTPVILRFYATQTFEDVPIGSTFHPYIEWMACRSIISGYPCGGPSEPCVGPGNRPYFRPGNPVTRGQLLKMVVNAATWPVVTPTTATFEDVPPGSTFYDYIETGVSHGVIQGYPCGGPFEPCVGPGNRPYFRPNNNITRGQISKVVALARSYPLPTPTTGTFEDVPPGSTFFSYVEAVYAQGIVVGYPCGTNPNEPCVPPGNRPYFRVGADATRGQVSKIVTIAYGGP